ncbi:MAG: cytochrome-c peroxidase [Chitinophagales bacterium]|nr:cytochrome-c peroxidase [Chitinophagales bacterium]
MRKSSQVVVLLFLFVCIAAFTGEQTARPYTFPVLKFFPKMPVSETNPVTIEGATLGRYLFYDSILSAHYTFSCASCHKQEYAFSDAPNRYSIGITGEFQSRNTMPLFNLAWYPSFFWDGKAKTIEEQIFHPVRAGNEMQLNWKEAEKRINASNFYRDKFYTAFGNEKIDSVLITKAIAQFLRTLISYNSKYDKVLRGEATFTQDEKDGFVLMNDMTKGDCLHCHTTDANALGTTLKFSNNGLDKIYSADDYTDKGRGVITGNKKENGLFKIPSLRNVAFTAPYMHDGRFGSLEEVVDFYSEGVNACTNIDSKMGFAHQHGNKLSCEEQEKIIAFLLTLSDSVFTSEQDFGNPFIRNDRLTE